MELKNQVTRLIKNNYELAQCLKTFTEDDLKSQRRFDLAPQPPEPGSVHVPPADGHEGKTSSLQQYTVPKTNGGKTEEQKGENKANQKLLTYPPSSKKLKQSTQTCTQQQQPKSNKQQQQQPTKKQDQGVEFDAAGRRLRPPLHLRRPQAETTSTNYQLLYPVVYSLRSYDQRMRRRPDSMSLKNLLDQESEAEENGTGKLRKKLRIK